MRQAIPWLCFLSLFSVGLSLADESPLNQAEVGDYVEFQGSAPSFGKVGKSDITLTIRYTVKAKTDSHATLTVKSWAGAREVAEHDIEVPLDKGFDAALLTPKTKDKSPVTLEKTIPDQKLKIKGKEFSGTVYQYKMSLDLFGGLVAEANPNDKSKPDLTMTVAYFVSPEAPVLGIAALTMNSVANVKYELSGGTGVDALLYPRVRVDKITFKVDDWLEYQGQNQPDSRLLVLRHTVKRIDSDAIVVAATLNVDGQTQEPWEFVVPRKERLEFVPHWNEFRGPEVKGSLARPRSTTKRFTILEDIEVKGTLETLTETATVKGEKEKLVMALGEHKDIPLTHLATIHLQRGTGIDVELVLIRHSGFIDLKNESATKKPAKTGTTGAKEKKSGKK